MNSTTINLESLLDLSARLGESSSVEHILNTALLSLMGKLRVTKACALLHDDKRLRPVVTKGQVIQSSFAPFTETQIFDCDGTHPELSEEGFVLCSPIYNKGQLRGAIAVGPSIGQRAFGEIERQYASLVSIIAANALQTAEHLQSLMQEKSRVELRNQMLESLFEMSTDLGSLFTKEQILQIFSFRLMGQVMVSRFALIMFNEDGSNTVPFNRFHSDFTEDVMKELRDVQRSVTLNEWSGSADTLEIMTSAKIELLVPLTLKNRTCGMLLIGKKMIGQFGEFDARFIEALGSTLATALENARLFEEEVEKKRIETELSVARQIQHKLFPSVLIQPDGAQVAARNISSQQVGGDYFDLIRVNELQLLMAIADVSGKGMPASILMANVQAALRILSPLVSDIREVVARINDVLYENTGHDKFVTFFAAQFNTQSKELTYTNAGHNPPMLFRVDGSVEELTEGGLILGVLPSFQPYGRGQVQLHSGDVLILFTDGVNEAMNAQQQEFSDESIRQSVHAHRHLSAQQILDALLHDVQRFVADAPQSDDITLLVLKID